MPPEPKNAAPATSTPAAPAAQKEPDLTKGQTIIAKTDDTVEATSGTYTVAAGRTVTHGNNGVSKDYKAGDQVELESGDAERLLKAGFILDKDGAAIIHADGPAVNVDRVQLAQPGA